MTLEESRHRKLTALRAPAYEDLFEGKPVAMFPSHELSGEDDGPFWIDVFAYELEVAGLDGPVVAAVTNGMSDQQMATGEDPDQPRRRELIQYLPECTSGHARRLRDMAWLPLHDGFLLEWGDTLAWEWPAVEGTPWKNAFFLNPIWTPHQEFVLEIEDDAMTFLWHVPISDEEREYKQQFGVDELLDRMQEAELPWLFDEANRPPLV